MNQEIEILELPVEISEQLEVIEKRNKFMEMLRKTKEFYRKRRILQTALVKALTLSVIRII